MSDTAFVIGMGEVGRRLKAALTTAGFTVVEVTRSEGWDRAAGGEVGLRVVCVREQVLEEVLGRLDGVPDQQIVLVQNGWIRPLLESRPHITRGLIWFTAKGEFFRVLRSSPFCGPAATTVASALSSSGIAAHVVEAAEFAGLDAEKMGFNCLVGLPLAVHHVSLGEYLEHYRDEARAVFDESARVCAAAAGAQPQSEWWDSFCEAVAPLGWVAASTAKALELRNGAVLRLAGEHGDEVPATQRLLAAVGWC